MEEVNKYNISDELLAAYLEGNTTPEETMHVLYALDQDEQLKEILITAERIDSMFVSDKPEYTLLPLEQMAAKSDGNLCDLQCEEYILRKLSVDFDETDLSEEARENRWLKEKGTPLHSVGRLLEKKGLSVIRRYNVSKDDLIQALESQHCVIVVVNADKLNQTDKGADNVNSISYHSIVLLDYNTNTDSVSVYDPASQTMTDQYAFDRFYTAWEDALFYLVSAKVKTPEMIYDPQPIDLEDIDLLEDLLELREAIAENAHDVWASARMKEGWTYGPVRDDRMKQNPDLVPYADLPDSEKQYDRDMAMNTIKLVKKLGYDLIKTSNTQEHRLLIKKLRYSDDVFHCKVCNALVFQGQVFCDQCGKKLDYIDYLT